MGRAPRVAAFLKPVSPRSFSGSKLSSGTYAPPVFLGRVSSNTSTPCLRQPREKRRKSKYSWEFGTRHFKELRGLLQLRRELNPGFYSFAAGTENDVQWSTGACSSR